MITDPLFYLFAVPAVFLVGLSKGGFGGTIALIGVPLMAFAVSPVTAAGILLPIMIIMDLVGLFAWRGRFDRGVLASMLPAALLGVALGYFTAQMVSADGIRLILGLLSLWFVADWLLKARRDKEPKPRNPLKAGFWGTVSGFASFVSHAGGPPYQIYVVPLKLSPSDFAGTAVVFFAVVNAVKLLPYFLLGQFSLGNLETSAVLAPLAPLATVTGVWLVRRIEPKVFYRLVYTLLVPVGLKLAFDGASGLLS
ncbi:sulfite exporter TauE/SafE family protein [Aurantimonas sp. VKM B-3413]|uniref:sulfite exporter TauE/SafE family protein n=1 Tax=Aurantimonas sp. VKM B-3413 TaxID=2779401 RepID=UPI001E3FA674|nr:sulfite exporter TauE/SafE family protein [Aurantimonas sp. VKM B-3413]MCB8839546.1 sulfite exporter TauE/SafE family protein [Aurantimonas sp. VKM B-3413]